MAKTIPPKQDPKDKDNNRQRGPTVNHSDGNKRSSDGQPKNDKQCCICGLQDHVQTNGPRGMKLVQYFACKTFSEWTNAERFNYLKTQGLCVQCLFPGADQKSGKHVDGRCQRDFTCKHPSHDKFTVKKHILVCDEHKDSAENKETLKTFKERCMSRARNLPDHAKNIQLHHVMSPPKISSHSVQSNTSKSTPETILPASVPILPASAPILPAAEDPTESTQPTVKRQILMRTPLPSIVKAPSLSTIDEGVEEPPGSESVDEVHQVDVDVLRTREDTSSYEVGPLLPPDEAMV